MISFANSVNEPLKKLIDTFTLKSGFKSDKKVLLLADKTEDIQSGFHIYVVPYGTKINETGKVVTYSLSNNNADVVSINIQNHSQSKSFEIMTNSGMGRAFINNKNDVSVENVLMCASVFYALGTDLFNILDVLNGFLK